MIFLTNPLHYALHHDLRWRLATRFEFAARQQAVSIARSEVSVLARHLLVLVQTVGDQRQVVALLKSSLYENAVIDSEGQWRRGPVPLLLRYHPFTIIQDGSNPDRLVLGVVADPDCLDKDEGEDFFDHLARPLPRVMAIQRRLNQIANEKKHINAAADRLQELGALSAIDLPDARGRQIYETVNIKALEAIAGPTLASLSTRPHDIIQLAAALDMSATLHVRLQRPAQIETVAAPKNKEPSMQAEAPQTPTKGSFLVDDDFEMRF
jgi:hypothetical protein